MWIIEYLHSFVSYLQSFSNGAKALFSSIILGAAATSVWAEAIYAYFYRNLLNKDIKNERIRWVGVVSGLLERGLITSLMLWQPQMAGSVAGAWLAVTAISGWTSEGAKENVTGRARFQISFLNCLFSLTWAIECGIWFASNSN